MGVCPSPAAMWPRDPLGSHPPSLGLPEKGARAELASWDVLQTPLPGPASMRMPLGSLCGLVWAELLAWG